MNKSVQLYNQNSNQEYRKDRTFLRMLAYQKLAERKIRRKSEQQHKIRKG